MVSRLAKAVAFDIDGVLLRGSVPIPGADEAIKLLQKHKIPFVFVTNGGGMHEAKKAAELRKKLGVNISDKQVIVCHTPFRRLAGQFGSQNVLLIGRNECLDVAKAYGFNRVQTPNMLLHRTPHLLPTRKVETQHSNEDPWDLSACFIFHDPYDWSLEMQVLHDVILTSLSKQGNRGHLPVFACNADLVYATEHPLPRFTQGAFVESFRHLFQITHQNSPIHFEYFGKPFRVQYEYAEEVLYKQVQDLGLDTPTVFYGIGDNPKSDIRGANNAGDHWRSLLVKTGLFTDKDGTGNDSEDLADGVFPTVLEAVQSIVSGSV